MKRFFCVVCLFIGMMATAVSQTHPWKGKKVAWFGDSISDPNLKAANKRYWELLSEWLGLESWVYAVSGRQWNDIPRQAKMLEQQHGQEVDAIVIFIGTNDFNAAVPIGQWYNEVDTTVLAAVHEPKAIVNRKMRTPCLDNTTVKGRINIALSMLKQMFPTKQIVLLTPIHRAFFSYSDNNIQPSEAYQNKIGEWFDSYIEAVKQAGNIWAVPVINLNALSGLYPLAESNHQFFNNAETDLLHPNDLGHNRMAKTLYYQLSTIPCGF